MSRVMRRDRRRCGIHVGGCGRELVTNRRATRDHMIPRSFISFLSADRSQDFDSDWNIQPMCPKCNNEVRESQLNDWPLFKCRCHFLQVGKDGGMYIHERTTGREKRHLLLEDVTSQDRSTFLFFSSRLPGSGNSVGYSTGGSSSGGHFLVPVLKKHVTCFNWFELARIGEARGSVLWERGNGERCVFLPDGRIASRSEHWCASRFPIKYGHRNLTSFDPFEPTGRRSIREAIRAIEKLKSMQ